MRYKALLIALLSAAGLFLALGIWLGPQKFFEAISKANLRLMVVAFVIEIIDLVVMAARWHVFLKDIIDIDFLSTLSINLAGASVSNITPSGRVGGEPLKAYILKKRYGMRYGAGFATIILERIVDMLAFTIISIIAILYGIFYFHLSWSVISLLFLALGFTGSMLVGMWYLTLEKRLRSKSIVSWLDRHQWITSHIPYVSHYKGKIADSLTNYYSNVARIAGHPDTMVAGFFISFIYWVVEISRAYVIFLALGVNPPFPVIALAYIFSAIVGSLPFGVGGVGLTEGTMIFIYSAGSINAVIASIETLLDRLLSYWLVIIAGLPLAGYLGISKNVEVDENGGLHDSADEGLEEREVRNN